MLRFRLQFVYFHAQSDRLLVIDTDVFIRAERQRHEPHFAPYAEYGAVFISAITVSALLVGVHRANTDARRGRRAAFVEGLLGQLPALDFTTDVARVHAEIIATLQRKGQLIGAHDLIIAATALAHALLTGNHREFERVSGLRVLQFAEQIS